MKALFLSSMLMASGVVSAGSITALPNPASPPLSNVHWMHCASIGFNADNSVFGACQISYGPSPGHYGHNAGIFYPVQWDAAGANPLLGPTACAYYPSGGVTMTITYLAPYTRATCKVDYYATGNVVSIAAGYYYYATTSILSGNELVNSNSQSYLVAP